MQQSTVIVFWIDLCANAINAHDIAMIPEMSAVLAVRRVNKDRISAAVEEESPHLICLDYDFPDRQNLQLLRQLRYDYPYIPVIMMTVQHSESLAVWAFRTGVRDYLVKPLPCNTILEMLNSMAMLANPFEQNEQNRPVPRRNLLAPPLIPNEFRHGAPPRQVESTAPAVSYVEAHFNERIAEKDLADLCGMTVFAFSKVFRSEHGMSFREFLIRYRTERAKDLLDNPAITATDVACLVGFSDASSFARFFRRYVGQTPSVYRRKTGQV